MDKNMTRVETIGVQLIKHKKITRNDILFLQKYYQQTNARKLTDAEYLKTDPRTLTTGQKAYRTWLLRYR